MRVKRDDLPTRLEIIRQGSALYLKNGFYEMTNKAVAQAAGVHAGSLNNCFPTKEDLLVVVLEKVAKIQDDFFDRNGADLPLLSEFGLEIAVRLNLCERHEKLGELYIAGYSMPKTMECIRRVSYKRTQRLLGGHLPEWTLQDFYEAEIMTSGMFFGCMMERCDARFTIRQKIERCLDHLLKIYDIEKEKRSTVIREVMDCDFEEEAEALFSEIMEKETA